jgi:hypothetical protein
LSFVNTNPQAYSSITYDTDTGVLLANTTSTAGAMSPVTEPGQPPPVGNTQLTITRFLGIRQRTLPGLDGANPEWVARKGSMTYAGTYDFVNPVDPSSGAGSFPMQLSVRLGQGGRNWTSYSASTVIQQLSPQPTTGNGVTGPAGIYWFDPRALATMTAGQSLDKDPLTTEQLTVAGVGAGPRGPAVNISDQLPGIANQLTYDQPTGALLALEAHEAGSGKTVRLQLQDPP